LSELLLIAVGWRLLFIITGLGACIWIIPWLWMVPATRPDRSQWRPSESWSLLLRRPTLWGVTWERFLLYFWYYCLTWLPLISSWSAASRF
jgi:predicted MFS family arabinose efflux permease